MDSDLVNQGREKYFELRLGRKQEAKTKKNLINWGKEKIMVPQNEKEEP